MLMGRNAEKLSSSGRQRTSQRFEVFLITLLGSIVLWDTDHTILGDSNRKVIPQLLTRLPKRVNIAAAISHVDPLLVLRHRAQSLHTAFPDLRFTLPFLSLG